MASICEICTTTDNEIGFSSVKALFEHKKSGHKNFEGLVKKEPKTAPESPKKPVKEVEAPPPPPKKPLVLKYKYEGQCDNGHEVDTILIPVGDKQMAVAYCPICKEQIKEQTVTPIGNERTKRSTP